MDINISTRIKLNNGIEMPILGFGTYLIKGEKTVKESLTAALDAGYRLIDTAQMYENEEYIGEAIQESRIPREEIFVTTKLDNNQHGFDKAKRAFDESMRRLKL
ncbi:MAG TPA: aldo/keto reductase, partial [Ignavibacteriaceae bacterium]|nr:aldo/keto reductase [Ignavibacteriaceae bacterium]